MFPERDEPTERLPCRRDNSVDPESQRLRLFCNHSDEFAFREEALPFQNLVDAGSDDFGGNDRRNLRQAGADQFAHLVGAETVTGGHASPPLEEFFTRNHLFGFARVARHDLRRLRSRESRFLQLSQNLLSPRAALINQGLRNSRYFEPRCFRDEFQSEFLSQLTGQLRAIQRARRHFLTVDGLAYDGAGDAVQADPNVDDDTVAMKLGIKVAAGGMLETGNHESDRRSRVPTKTFPCLARDFFKIADHAFGRRPLRLADNLFQTGNFARSRPELGNAFGSGERQVPTRPSTLRPGIPDQFLAAVRAESAHESAIDDILHQAGQAKRPGSFPEPDALRLAAVEQIVIAPDGRVIGPIAPNLDDG